MIFECAIWCNLLDLTIRFVCYYSLLYNSITVTVLVLIVNYSGKIVNKGEILRCVLPISTISIYIFELWGHTLRPLLILWHPNYYNFKHLQKSKDGMVLGRHSTSTRAFRLRKKRGSFRLRKKDMNYIPLSYLDTYYALGKQRSFPYYESSAGLPRPPIEYHNRTPDDDMIEEGKRASFRLKKIPKNSGQIWSEPRSAKRASFRLKRILDSYKDLLGSPSGSATRLPHLIIYY